jgi:hypothetical protein
MTTRKRRFRRLFGFRRKEREQRPSSHTSLCLMPYALCLLRTSSVFVERNASSDRSHTPPYALCLMPLTYIFGFRSKGTRTEPVLTHLLMPYDLCLMLLTYLFDDRTSAYDSVASIDLVDRYASSPSSQRLLRQYLYFYTSKVTRKAREQPVFAAPSASVFVLLYE